MTTEKAPLPLSEEELKEIEVRVNAATPGPWYTKKTGANFEGFSLEVTIAATARGEFNRVYATPPHGQFPGADQNLIAHARTDIPRLLATIKELKTQLAQERTLSSHHLPPTGKDQENPKPQPLR